MNVGCDVGRGLWTCLARETGPQSCTCSYPSWYLQAKAKLGQSEASVFGRVKRIRNFFMQSSNHRKEVFGRTSGNCLLQPSCTQQGQLQHLAQELEVTVSYVIALDALVLAVVYVKFPLLLFWSVCLSEHFCDLPVLCSQE